MHGVLLVVVFLFGISFIAPGEVIESDLDGSTLVDLNLEDHYDEKGGVTPSSFVTTSNVSAIETAEGTDASKDNINGSLGEKNVSNDSLEVKNDEICGPPPTVQRASLIGSRGVVRTSISFKLGAVVNYACEFGFVVQGSKRTSTCIRSNTTEKGEWTQPQMACIPRSCGDPGFVLNTRRVGSLFTFPNNVSYQCEEGYKLRGSGVRYCQASGTWSGRVPSCEKIVCPPPEIPDHGQAIYSSLEYGSELRYECDKGYGMQSSLIRTCLANGTWSYSNVECSEVQCDAPKPPEFGSVQVLGAHLKVGSIAVYSCDGGRILRGVSKSRCLENGQWLYDAPTCLGPCVISKVMHGQIGAYVERRSGQIFSEIRPGNHYMGSDSLILRCNVGYHISGAKSFEKTIHCNGGIWSENFSCESMSCSEDPPPTPNATVKRKNNDHGGTVVYECDRLFTKAAYGNVTCNFGKWEGITPVCKNTRCFLSELNYAGLKKGTKTTYYSGQSFYPTCVQGFEVTTPNTAISCDKGDWVGNASPCKPDNEPIQKLALDVTSTEQELHTSVPLLEIQRSTAANEELKMQATIPPQILHTTLSISTENACTCDYINTDTNLLAYVDEKMLKYGSRVAKGSIVNFHCKDGGFYNINGVKNAICETCGQLLSYPECQLPVRGDSVISVDRKIALTSDGAWKINCGENLRLYCSEIGSVVYPTWVIPPTAHVYSSTYIFSHGGISDLHTILDIVQASLLHSGEYKCFGPHERPKVISIQVVDPMKKCPKLVEDERYIIEYENDRMVNTRATFYCKRHDQKILGNNVLLCNSTAQWNGRISHCLDSVVKCPKIEEDETHTIEYENERMVNSNATIRCKRRNQKILGNNKFLCNSTGQWTGIISGCVDKTCPELNASEGMSVSYSNDRKINDLAVFHCFQPRKLVGNPFVKCLDNESWSAAVPVCALSNCSVDSLFSELPEGIFVDMENESRYFVPYGTILPLKCEGNLRLSIPANAKCDKDGKWLYPKVYCVNGCPPIPNSLESSLIVIPEMDFYRFGDSVTLSCPPGLRLTKDVQVVICLGNRWSEENFPDCII